MSDLLTLTRARAGFISLVAADRRSVILTAAEGLPSGFVRRYRQVPLSSPLPCAEAVRSGEPVFFGSNHHLAMRFAALAQTLHEVGEALAVLPLRVDGRPVGALVLSFLERRGFPNAETEWFEALGRCAADALGGAGCREERRLDWALNRLDEAVIVASLDLRVRFANAAAVELLGPPRLAEGDRLPERWRGTALGPVIRSIAEQAAGETHRVVLCSGRERHELTVAVADDRSRVLIRLREDTLAGYARDAVGRMSQAIEEVRQATRSLARNGAAEQGHPAHATPAATAQDVCHVGDIRIDLLGQEAMVGGRRVRLTPSELKLLALLAQQPGRAVPRGQIVRHLWQSGHLGDGRMCDGHVANLRRKIERDPRHPERVLTVRGVGYTLRPS
jgi:DNA-binding winged helix-turn-helix (wHTH) protein/PAS domain-containing protein